MLATMEVGAINKEEEAEGNVSEDAADGGPDAHS